MLSPVSVVNCFCRDKKMFFKVNDNAVSYAATTVAATLMHSVFQFYYVKLFLDHYRYVIATFFIDFNFVENDNSALISFCFLHEAKFFIGFLF